MTIEIDALVETYTILKEYITSKDRQAAADHVMSVLVDSGVSEQDLKVFSGTDSYLKRSAEEYLDVDDSDVAELDDNYDDE